MNKFIPDKAWMDWCNRTRHDKGITTIEIGDSLAMSATKISKILTGLYPIDEEEKTQIREMIDNAKHQKVYADPAMTEPLLRALKNNGHRTQDIADEVNMGTNHIRNIIAGNVRIQTHSLKRIIDIMTRMSEE